MNLLYFHLKEIQKKQQLQVELKEQKQIRKEALIKEDGINPEKETGSKGGNIYTSV